ncbi:MAG TPA: 50S ribosomal protein L5 [Thermoleophilia bacterium]|nr:50S ribosomal protein L5 [Thermoleophilia bacterium]
MARLKDKYFKEIVPALMSEFSYRTVMEVPRVTKVTLNMGVGEAKTNAKVLDQAIAEMALIAGQQPAITKARKSIASFKLREGMSIGCRVTLRGQRMYEMMDRLVSIALPRIRDFRGISPDQFDGRGNFAMGVREQTIFPEIEYDSVEQSRGLNIVITTTAKTDEEGRALLNKLGMPFRSN